MIAAQLGISKNDLPVFADKDELVDAWWMMRSMECKGFRLFE
jgi:hypothetical protein